MNYLANAIAIAGDFYPHNLSEEMIHLGSESLAAGEDLRVAATRDALVQLFGGIERTLELELAELQTLQSWGRWASGIAFALVVAGCGAAIAGWIQVATVSAVSALASQTTGFVYFRRIDRTRTVIARLVPGHKALFALLAVADATCETTGARK